MRHPSGLPFEDGTVPFTVPSVDKEGVTYYRVYGDLHCGKRPVVCLHGGPGTTIKGTMDFAAVWPEYGIPVVLYDQIGCGKSTNLDVEKRGDRSFWRIPLFLDELDNLLEHLKLRDGTGFDLLGHSFGTMLAAEYAARRPKGLHRLVLSSPISSADNYIAGVQFPKNQLPAHHSDALDEGVRTGDYTSQAFKDGYLTYWRHCLCRADPLPPMLEKAIDAYASCEHMLESAMFGPCPIATTDLPGSLRGWTVIPDLHRITAPTLLLNGEWDQSHDGNLQPMFERIPRVRWFQFAGASHIIFWESEELRQGVIKLIGGFLSQVEDGLHELEG